MLPVSNNIGTDRSHPCQGDRSSGGELDLEGGSKMTEGVLTRPRDRIVEAARDLFHTQGYRGVGVDAIAEAAGTNKMTLYRHFDSKDELIVECLRTAIAEARSY